VIVCCRFAQCLAYYRVQRSTEFCGLLDPEKTDGAGSRFWSAVNGALFDSCVLDWCKLFGRPKEHHHWRKVVIETAGFEAELLNHLGLNKEAFQQVIENMLEHRDKWVAHLDSETKGTYPTFDIAKKAVWFYHAYAVKEAGK
jgi:AbiU2